MAYQFFLPKVLRACACGAWSFALYSPYRSYQRFCHKNEAKGSFCIEMTLKLFFHVVLNKRKCSCRLNSNKDYCAVPIPNKFCLRLLNCACPRYVLPVPNKKSVFLCCACPYWKVNFVPNAALIYTKGA